MVQGMDPITATWASALFNCWCAYWHSFGQLSQAMPGHVLVLGIFHNRQYWWGYFILGRRQLTYRIASCAAGWRRSPGPVYLLVEIQPLRPELAFLGAKFLNYHYNKFLIKSHSYATKKSKCNVLKCMLGHLLNWWKNKSDIFDAVRYISIWFYAKNTCQRLSPVVYKTCDSLTLHILFSSLSGCGRLAAPDLGQATFNIIAISSDQSYFSWKFIFFACDTKYYLLWRTPAVYDPFLWRHKSSMRHTAPNKLTVCCLQYLLWEVA